MQRGSRLLQTSSAKLSERYIQTLQDMCSVMFRFFCKRKVKSYIKKDVFLLKFEHLLIIRTISGQLSVI